VATASNWSQSLNLPAYDSSAFDSSLFPSSTTSLATLTGDLLFDSQNSFCDTSDWTTFASQPANLSAFTCDDLSSFSLVSTAGLNAITMPSFPDHVHDTFLSQPMEKGIFHKLSLSFISNNQRSLKLWFLYNDKLSQPEFVPRDVYQHPTLDFKRLFSTQPAFSRRKAESQHDGGSPLPSKASRPDD